MPTLITLTSDFGTRDPYVAAMKGVILERCPEAQIIDLSHDIAAQDVFEAALFIAGCADRFPPGTIHVVVVDPGVGSDRRGLVAQVGFQRFVCPDNGLLTLLLQRLSVEAAHAITNPAFMLPKVSATFHGRDVFAPTAAALAAGGALDEAGPAVQDLVALDIPQATRSGQSVSGAILHIDHFGNAITNIHRSHLGGATPEPFEIGGRRFDRLCATYGEVPKGDSCALFGSGDYLEFAINGGNAAEDLSLVSGLEVELQLK
jgi:S-adenosyl-L-methionine hydrolase (adenosine-forming)